MIIGIPKENTTDETRIALTPSSVKRLVSEGASMVVENGLGEELGFTTQDYLDAGAQISESTNEILKAADIVLRLNKPSLADIAQLKKGAVHISFLDPFNEPELVDAFTAAEVTAISMEMIPRTTRAQKMDALSSQASLAGYAMVILAAERLNKILPMMMTPAGTIKPSRVFVIGAGVAGLQAIATAKRLGARVDAFDTRPVVKEQVESLGGKFVEIDLGDTGQTDGGYAKQLTEEQLELQRQGQKKIMAQSDIVITTAQLFGRPAPRIISTDMVEAMQAGSVIIDLAASTGGNVEGSVSGQEIEHKGVKIIGYSNMAAHVALNASDMYSANLHNLISEYWNKESKTFVLDLEDDILNKCVVTHNGKLINEMLINVRAANQQSN